jgi:hypothetical protein
MFRKAKNRAKEMAIKAKKVAEAEKALVNGFSPEKQTKVAGIRANTLQNMKPGIRMDLQDKLTKGVFIPPLDLEKIAQDVYNPINNVVQAKLAMRVMGIGLTEILQLLKEICEEDKITYLKKDGSVPNS